MGHLSSRYYTGLFDDSHSHFFAHMGVNQSEMLARVEGLVDVRSTLERSIPFRSYVALGLGVIVGVCWVVYSGQWLQDGGSLGALLETLIPAIATDPLYFVGMGSDQERVSLSTILPGLIVGALLIRINYRGAGSSARI